MTAACQRIFIVMPQSRRAFRERLDFLTSLGHGDGAAHRARLGLTTTGPAKVITDLCVMEPHAESRELTVTSIHPGVSKEQVRSATEWPVQFVQDLPETPRPEAGELEVLRTLLHR
jgi:glutaconate CoA-transferase subunit B